MSRRRIVGNGFSSSRIDKIMRLLGIRRREEAEAYAFQAMADPSPEIIDLFSDVDEIDVLRLSLMDVVAKRYGLNWLQDWKNAELRLRVSLNRAGRREFVQMVARGRSAEQPARPWFLSRLLRRKQEEVSMV